MRSPRETSRAMRLYVVLTPSTVPTPATVEIVNFWPAFNSTGFPSTSFPVRIFGPCKSARIPMGCESRADASRKRLMVCA